LKQHRLNRELGADFDLNNFGHRAVWNRVESRIEMHLESTRDHQVRISCAELNLHFVKGETIHTENSYKFTQQAIRILLEGTGFDVEQTWLDNRAWYAVTLARISKKRHQHQTDLCDGSQVPDLATEFSDVPHQPSVLVT
jgi:uncharacterized SAM-dependent methyltransferase